MGRAKLAALRTSKALALLKIQLQKQPAWFAFKSAFRYFPSRFELQGRRKQCFRCHRPLFPLRGDLQGPAMRPLFPHLSRAPRATLKITSYALTHSQQREAKMGITAASICRRRTCSRKCARATGWGPLCWLDNDREPVHTDDDRHNSVHGGNDQGDLHRASREFRCGT